MAALTRTRRTPRLGALLDFSTRQLAAGARIFGGGLVLAEADGYVRSGAAVAGSIIGVARGNADNTDGADGDMSVIVDEGTFGFAAGSITVADIGAPVYVTDDQTVTLTSGTAFVGIVNTVVDGLVYVTISSELSGVEGDEAALVGRVDALETFTPTLHTSNGTLALGINRCASSATSMTLPAKSTAIGKSISVVNATGADVTITRAGSDTISGGTSSTTYVLPAVPGVVTFLGFSDTWETAPRLT